MPRRLFAWLMAVVTGISILSVAAPVQAHGDWNTRRWQGGPRFGAFIGPPPFALHRPPVVLPPRVVVQPVWILVPVAAVRPAPRVCLTAPVICALPSPRDFGAPCQCRTGFSVYQGHAG